MRKSVTVDFPEIEVIEDNPIQEIIVDYLKKNKQMVTSQANVLLKHNTGRSVYWLEKLQRQGIITSTIKLVKMKADVQFKRQRVWTLKK